MQLYDYTVKEYLPSAPGIGMFVEIKDPDDQIILSRVSFLNNSNVDLTMWFLEKKMVFLNYVGVVESLGTYFFVCLISTFYISLSGGVYAV